MSDGNEAELPGYGSALASVTKLRAEHAQHTAELTARAESAETLVGEWEDWALGHCDPPQGEPVDDALLRELLGMHITALEAQLTASAQREASARAEAREAALREAMQALENERLEVVAGAREVAQRGDQAARLDYLACAATVRVCKARVEKLLTSPPPPRGCSCDSPTFAHDVACPLYESTSDDATPLEALAKEFKQAADDFARMYQDGGIATDRARVGAFEQAHRMLVAAMAQMTAHQPAAGTEGESDG